MFKLAVLVLMQGQGVPFSGLTEEQREVVRHSVINSIEVGRKSQHSHFLLFCNFHLDLLATADILSDAVHVAVNRVN